MAMKTTAGNHGATAKGRGAGANPEGRFEKVRREAVDDGWLREPTDDPARPKTTVTIELAKSIISRHDSPDLNFTQSVNPYRGCEHGCIYCASGDTLILMGDGRTRPLSALRVGDEIFGTRRVGWYRRYVKSRVLAHWSTIKPAWRITLEDGTSLVTSGDHRFLTERGWKFVTGAVSGRLRRPHLTLVNKLLGTGAFAQGPVQGGDYRRGYLCGLIRGDGHLKSYQYERCGRCCNLHGFRLALCDPEALLRAQDYLLDFEIATQEFAFQSGARARRAMHAIRTHALPKIDSIRRLIGWPSQANREWSAGFLAGIFDAEGSFSQGVLRVSNADAEFIGWIAKCMSSFGFEFAVGRGERGRLRPIEVVRLRGGLREHLRFFHSVLPAITRKLDITGQALKSDSRLRATCIEPLGKAYRLYDITTETGDFIANGVVSHNCYARPSHAYLGLSPGIDFETRLFAKDDAARLLREELARPGYRCEPINIGSNTDGYQPIERSRRISRSILEVLHETSHPVAIITKSALVERDLDLIAPMGAEGLAAVAVSVTTLDAGLARRMEPRASAPSRRIEAIRRLAAAGVPVGVNVAPIIPFLTDHEIESILDAAAQAGAAWASWTLVRLPWEVKDLFRDWLEHHVPLKAAHVMSRLNEMRGGRDNDPRFRTRMTGEGLLSDLLRRRFEAACTRLGVDAGPPILARDRFRPPRIGGQLRLF
ncbi:MAG: PA0069 family radical SAM protein [Betaproteobacteria bacterium]|nr:PA0069 family radical SAM protein [Betaproteobacteria bacterium]